MGRTTGATAVRPLVRSSLAEAAAAELRRAIQDGRYRPGERLRQEALAEALAVSRTPLREALVQLAAEGLIEESTQGYRVAAPEVRHVLDLFEVVAVIEAQAARLAALRSDDHWRERIERAASSGPLTGRGARPGPAAEFHDVVAESTGNPALVRLRAYAMAAIDTIRPEAARLATPPDRADSRASHQGIAAAILAGDAEVAARLAAAHVRGGAARAAAQLGATELLVPGA